MSAYYTVDISASNNADFRQSFVLTDNAGTPLDLTGATFEMDIRDASGTELLSATSANSRVAITNAAAGAFSITILAADLSPIAGGEYVHDLLMRQAGKTSRIWAGAFYLAEGVSQ